MKQLLLLVLWTFSTLTGAFGEFLWSPLGGFFLDPPEGWTFAADPTPEHLVMTDTAHRAIFEVYTQNSPPSSEGVKEKATKIKTRLGAQGEEVNFDWSGRPVHLADYSFTAGTIAVRGWFLFLSDEAGRSWTVLAYAPVSHYEQYSDDLVSILNSFAAGEENRRSPGVLSTLFTLGGNGKRRVQPPLFGLPENFRMAFDLDQDEMVQAAAERESRLLIPHVGKPSLDKAWSRFYRVLYREIFESLGPLADHWGVIQKEQKWTPRQTAETLLGWLQKLKYQRKGGLTDLSTPYETLSSGEGDCDSRALIYLAVLEHLKISGILMVSGEYKHGMAALDLPGQGARFPHQGQDWIVAELTAPVQLGQIDSGMADPDKWLGIDLWGKP